MARWPGLAGWAGATCLSLAACGGGGGNAAAPAPSPGPAPAPAPSLAASDLAVLIADGDATSEAIALAYQKARGIPDANLIRLAVPRGSDSISTDDFATLKASLDAKLPATAQAMLLTWTQPSRVAAPVAAGGSSCSMGITSALTLGYNARYCGKCVSPTTSAYYNVDTRKPWTDLKLRPSMMLGAATLAEAQTLIARGVAADASMLNSSITPQAWLVRTSDASRSVRYPDFQMLASSSLAGVGLHYVDNSAGLAADEVTGQTNVMFYLTGLAVVAQAASNSYLPGAVADTLTSYGGYLPDGQGQMPITVWLQAGLTGSYGTQEEPCNYTEKFSRATVLVARYRKGETLIEAYWKSVQSPGQGLFIGEPLARPWAVPP
jgi:uncharacterized protein (TIGR03790 family)